MVEILNLVKHFSVNVNGKRVKLNAIGALQVGVDTALVLSDMPELNISKEEFEIVLLVKEGGSLSLQSIESDDLYNNLCELWAIKVKEEAGSDS